MESRQRLPNLRVTAYTYLMVAHMNKSSDFYEDDEPTEDVIRAYESGARGITAVPARSFLFTFVLPHTVTPSRQVGEWTSTEVPVATASLTNVG